MLIRRERTENTGQEQHINLIITESEQHLKVRLSNCPNLHLPLSHSTQTQHHNNAIIQCYKFIQTSCDRFKHHQTNNFQTLSVIGVGMSLSRGGEGANPTNIVN